MLAPKEILNLVKRFDANREAFLSGAYSEAQVRVDFIDPFFAALGWDIRNERGKLEPYREVIHEDSLRISGSVEAPDLCFRAGNTRKFFVECKKPSVNLKEGINPAYQLRRYAWSAKLPFSILTDFEEFIVYDCRTKPKEKDSPKIARHLYLTYKDYAEKWDEIASYFSREAVLGGSLDKYAQKMKGKRGTEEVDDDFLVQIERWRELLAKNIATLNSKLTVRELNFAVQQTIDRIIFLRICEDREIESFGSLRTLLNGVNIYKRLMELFYKADHRYNSGLFHFSPERGRDEPPDELSATLKIDDKPIKEVVEKLYYPSPYAFSVIPAEILGQVYERFLGKVISLTKDHNAKVEEKPEVRKAGGVYYTPTYIVDYIVKNTVGKLLEGKTPKQAEKLKILDPACGSGSFLIGAFQYLIDWHRNWYFKDGPQKHQKVMYQSKESEWHLTTAEKKRILVNNIFGVDIDTQAVEVTKLSLLLKVLENENEQTLEKQLKLLHERALPDLGHNIKCGNSLIRPDFYSNQQGNLFAEEKRCRINAFDWDEEFSEIMKASGFDVVIGNPPYVFGRDWKYLNISDDVKLYLRNAYKSSPYQLDMFSIFMERANTICKTFGYVGLIVPNVWLTNKYSSSTRAFILNNSSELSITAPPKNVFQGITVDTIVYTLKKSDVVGKYFYISKISNDGVVTEIGKFNTADYKDGELPISTTLSSSSYKLVFKLKEQFPELRQYTDITRGVHPYRIGGYGKSAFGGGAQTSRDVQERPYHSNTCRKGYRPFIYGRDLQRFTPPFPTEYVNYGPWLAEPRDADFFKGERIYSRKILGDRLVVTIETSNSIADQQVYITRPRKGIAVTYLAAILGSKLMAFYIRYYFNEVDDAFPQIKVEQLKSLPIKTVSSANSSDKIRHDKIVNLVEQMLELNRRIASKKTEHEKNTLQRQIAATDQQIDKLVYELYALTEEEIKIVEE